jgi:(5-formylfuran-3-yl)methyl phosphate transaminase
MNIELSKMKRLFFILLSENRKNMNKAVEKMTPFIVMDVLERANQLQSEGVEVIHLEVGEPDFETPGCINEAIVEAQNSGLTHYTHSLGNPELRNEIAAMYKKDYGVEVDPECILVTSGSSPAILMTLMLLCDENDEVIMSNPGYPCYKNFTLACHANPVFVDLHPENGFRYDVEDIKTKITAKTKAVFVNSPMNPTGGIIEAETMKQLAEIGVPIISDEIYHGLVYGEKPHSMLEFSDNVFVVNGFSKKYAMTGLRLGYVIAPKMYIRELQILQQNLFICAPSTAQIGGIVAMRRADEDVRKMCGIYNERRLFMLNRLKKMGFVVHSEPLGAFYIYCDARKFTCNSYEFAFEILEKVNVGITPGVDFGSNGEGFVRFSYANSIENIEKAMSRLEKYLFENYSNNQI